MTLAAERSSGVLTLRGAAAFLKVHPNTIRSQAKRRLIPATKVGRDWRFLEADLVEWIRSAYPERATAQQGARDGHTMWNSEGLPPLTAPSSQALVERSLDALLARPTG
ncbi:MAG: helix-turn-helix domain-containing protein [Sphingomicrobium sp.]